MKKPALKRIFISYAHEDRDLAEQVSAALPRELPNCRVKVWSDLEIRGGQPWLEEIQRQLEHADVAVLLVSAHYASSKFVASEELPKVMSRYLSRGACCGSRWTTREMLGQTAIPSPSCRPWVIAASYGAWTRSTCRPR